MSEATAKTGSVLASMAASITGAKAAKTATLTPVAGETRNNPLAGFLPAFPYDDPQTMLAALRTARANIITARTELDHVLTGIDALMVTLAGEGADAPTTTVDIAAERKAREKAADIAAANRAVAEAPTIDAAVDVVADFNARFRAQQAAAQAATYKAPTDDTAGGDGAPEDPPAPTDGWVCPEHGQMRPSKTKKGRDYRVCPVDGCGEFEKLQ